jgi:hypothetical protein
MGVVTFIVERLAALTDELSGASSAALLVGSLDLGTVTR